MPNNNITEAGKLLWRNWGINYRYNGGLPAAWRCLHGSQVLRRGKFTRTEIRPPLADVVTFSVLPQLTALWIALMNKVIDTSTMSILIADCSGSLQNHIHPGSAATLIPMLNYEHGEKMDLFLYKICQAKYVVVTDDDIFWLDKRPLQWALAQLDSDPQIASASFLPKRVARGQVDDKEHLFLGSSFVIRRQAWLDERLSFKIDYSPRLKGRYWFYEIGELAQAALLERNYKMAAAPPEIQEDLLTFEGISHWTLKIRKRTGDLSAQFRADPRLRSKKALEAVYTARGLKELIMKYYPEAKEPGLIPERSLQRAEAGCLEILSKKEASDIQSGIEERLSRLNEKLASLS